MTNEIRANETLVSDIPAGLRLAALAQLQTGENVLAVLEVDLNQKLFFVRVLEAVRPMDWQMKPHFWPLNLVPIVVRHQAYE